RLILYKMGPQTRNSSGPDAPPLAASRQPPPGPYSFELDGPLTRATAQSFLHRLARQQAGEAEDVPGVLVGGRVESECLRAIEVGPLVLGHVAVSIGRAVRPVAPDANEEQNATGREAAVQPAFDVEQEVALAAPSNGKRPIVCQADAFGELLRLLGDDDRH